MGTEADIHLRFVENALGYHRGGTSRALLGGLEEEEHLAPQSAGFFTDDGGQHLGCAKEHGHMRVVPAGVHPAFVP